MHSLRCLSLAVTAVICATHLSPAAFARGSRTEQTKIEEYVKRLTQTPPLDADAFVELARWCERQQLAERAKQAYHRAITIDTECAAARRALGFERYGTGWRRIARNQLTERTAAVAAVRGETGTTQTVATDSDRIPEAEKRETTESKAAAQRRSMLEWAHKTEERFGVPFHTDEERNLLIHTTVDKGDDVLKRLRRHLDRLRRSTAKLIGTSSRRVLGKRKLQIVLLRSESEFDRFAKNIDGVTSARNPTGAYRRGERIVLWQPESRALAAVLSETALAELHREDAWLSRWIYDGVEQMVTAATPTRETKQLEEEIFAAAGDLLEDEENARQLLFELLEESGPRLGRTSRQLSMTFVAYLAEKNKLDEFLEAMKGKDAPESPAPDDGAFAEFHMRYVPYQERALRRLLGDSSRELLSRWRDFVLKRAAKAKANRSKPRPRNSR